MVGVKYHTPDVSMLVEETTEASPERSDPCPEGRNDTESESPSTNVSQDMCLSLISPNPQASPLLSSSKFHANVTSSQDSQASTRGPIVAPPQQPSPEYLLSLGIKVRDFAYEDSLPAIVPVPRVPRQVQPAPRALKRSHRDWDDKEGSSISLSPVRPLSGQTPTKKPRSLERKATEPLQEPVIQYTRMLERITVKKVCSMLTPPSRRTLPTTPRARFSASPPTSPLTPLPSQETDLIQRSSAFPFVVRVDNAGVTPTSQPDSESLPVSLRPVLYTTFTMDSRSSPDRSAASGPPETALPTPLLSSLVEVPSQTKEPGVGVRKRRARRTPASSDRYQLRQRPISSSRASNLPHQVNTSSKLRPRRTRHVR